MTGGSDPSRAYGTIVVCGGGCYGGYYVRQLARARAAGALSFERILVVDHDRDCRVAHLIAAIDDDDSAAMLAHGWALRRSEERADAAPIELAYRGLPIAFVPCLWSEFFTGWFGSAIADPGNAARDAVVPSPLMPNLLADWVTSRLAAYRPHALVERVPMAFPPVTPWSREGTDGSHYASFATWMCPINCVEPARCPETRGPRDWSMPVAVRLAAEQAAERGAPFQVIAIFRTTHRAYGVGMFDVADAIAADAAIARSAADDTVSVLVASVSHCHGALAEMQSKL